MCAPKPDPAHEQSFYPLHQKLMINCHLTLEWERLKNIEKGKEIFPSWREANDEKENFIYDRHHDALHASSGESSLELCHPFPFGRCSLGEKNWISFNPTQSRRTLPVLRWKIFVHSKRIKICWLKIQFRFFCLFRNNFEPGFDGGKLKHNFSDSSFQFFAGERRQGTHVTDAKGSSNYMETQ